MPDSQKQPSVLRRCKDEIVRLAERGERVLQDLMSPPPSPVPIRVRIDDRQNL